MSTRTYTLNFTGAGTGTLPAGVFFKVMSAAANITIRTRGSTSSPIEFTDVGEGLKFGPVDESKRWTYLDVQSAVAQVVTVIVSDDGEVDVAGTGEIAGDVDVVELPASTIATPAADVIANGAALAVAANSARRRITICNLSSNLGSVFVQATGAGAGRGIEVQPGMNAEMHGIYAFDVRNDSGASVTVTRTEEA
jgi:hypothetical protein